jgi:hypothetical protein
MVNVIRGCVGLLGVVALSACSVSTTPNSVTGKTQPEFFDDKQPAKTSSQDWTGGDIEIRNDGVNPLFGDGGISVVIDPNATRITAAALFVARADAEKESEAQQSIRDAIATFMVMEEGGKTTVHCGHGNDHGSSGKAASGCKKLTVTIPSGSADRPHNLTIGSGNGNVNFSTTLFVRSLSVLSNGSGDLKVAATPVKGASIQVLGRDQIDVYLPGDFASDAVHLVAADANTDEEKAARILTADFPGLAHGQPFGTTGTGAAELKVETQGILDSDTITIHKQ